MASRHERPSASSANTSEEALEAKANETARTIAGLRERLWQQDLFIHPHVTQELQALLEQMAVLLSWANPRRGRHRIDSDSVDQAASKPPKSDLEPNPLAASTAAEFIEVLWQYRTWHGNPSWRQMAARAKQAVVFSTMYNAMNSDTLPKFDVMKAIIIGCDGGEADLELFTKAWHRIERHTARQAMANRMVRVNKPNKVRPSLITE